MSKALSLDLRQRVVAAVRDEALMLIFAES
jgi:hypothetical protein